MISMVASLNMKRIKDGRNPSINPMSQGATSIIPASQLNLSIWAKCWILARPTIKSTGKLQVEEKGQH